MRALQAGRETTGLQGRACIFQNSLPSAPRAFLTIGLVQFICSQSQRFAVRNVLLHGGCLGPRKSARTRDDVPFAPVQYCSAAPTSACIHSAMCPSAGVDKANVFLSRGRGGPSERVCFSVPPTDLPSHEMDCSFGRVHCTAGSRSRWCMQRVIAACATSQLVETRVPDTPFCFLTAGFIS